MTRPERTRRMDAPSRPRIARRLGLACSMLVAIAVVAAMPTVAALRGSPEATARLESVRIETARPGRTTMAQAASSSTALQRVSPQAMRQAQAGGEVPVMVLLREDASRASSAFARLAKRAAGRGASLHPKVQAEVDAVLRGLPARGQGRVLRRFARVPAIALRADTATLAALARDPRVARVDVDVGGSGAAVAADASSVLNRVHDLATYGATGAGMKVAVVDTGIDTNHADFVGRIVGQQCYCTVNGGCCPNGAASQSGAGSAEDDQGHGTNVAGIIGGAGNVAPKGALPQVSLVAVKVISSANRFNSTADIVAALDWIAANHPDVDAVNLSLGTDALFAGDCDTAASWTQALAIAIDNLNALGAVVTASSGNNGNLNSMSAPACVRNVVSTAATWDFSGGTISFLSCTEAATAPMQPTCFSNRSTTTDLFAAGAFVTAPGFNGATSSFAGTSQAAPMAAACATALKQVSPVSTVLQRMQTMTLSSTRLADPASGRTYPFLDCRDAIWLLRPDLFPQREGQGGQALLPPNRRG